RVHAQAFGQVGARHGTQQAGRQLDRDRAIGRLLFYSGVRIAELVALDDDDVPEGSPLWNKIHC
ncbi:hypothetical protein ACVCAG_42630, partial [Streptosporangium sp. G12]